MASRAAGRPEGPDARGGGWIARREAQRQARGRRRRLIAGGALAMVALAIAAVTLSSAGGGSKAGGSNGGGASNRAAAENATAGTPGGAAGTAAAGRPSGLVRNATPQPGWKPYTGPVPILEYHVLGAAPAGAPYPEPYGTRPDFHRQLDCLDEDGYQAVTRAHA